MGNENSRSQQTVFEHEEKNPLTRVERLISQERSYMKEQIEVLKNMDQNTVSAQRDQEEELLQIMDLLDALNYFQIHRRILDAKSRHEEEIQQAQCLLLKTKESYQQLSSLPRSTLESKIKFTKQLEEIRLQQKEAKGEIQFLNIQIQALQEDIVKEKDQFIQQIQDIQQDSFRQQEQLQREYQEFSLSSQEQFQKQKTEAETTINRRNQLRSLIEKELLEKQMELQGLQAENETKEQKIRQMMDQINEQGRVDEILKATQLSKATTQEDFKNQLEKLNPQQEVNQGQIEFVKQFQAVQEEKLTPEQLKVLEKKHQQAEQVLIKKLKENQEKPQSLVSEDEKNKIEGYRGVLLMHAMLAKQGITTYITNKPIKELEQSSKARYQQNIIQCGIQDTATYFAANYVSPQLMKKQLLETVNLQNYIQNFKNDMAEKLNEEDITPQSIKVFAVTISPPCVNFQIFSDSGKKADVKKKDFSSLNINVSTQNLLDKAELSIEMFAPAFNMEWERLGFTTDLRGNLKFHDKDEPTPQIYRFPLGFYGLGLRVLDRYEKNEKWIRMDTQEGTWIVLFHGTGHKNLKGIIDSNKINPGIHNAYGGSQCRITGTIIKAGKKVNTYLADDVNEAEPYSIWLNEVDNVPYSLVFQCRVNPKKVKSPEDCPSYYTVENPLDDIRPYRLLIKQHNDLTRDESQLH